jgi:hypothetical protein
VLALLSYKILVVFATLKMHQEELGKMNANALGLTINVLTPVILGVAFVNTLPKIKSFEDAGIIAVFLIWMAYALLVQRLPVALIEVRKERLKERGALWGHISWIAVQLIFVYLFPIWVFWIGSPQSRMMAVVLAVDFVLQAYLAYLLWQKYRASEVRPLLPRKTRGEMG